MHASSAGMRFIGCGVLICSEFMVVIKLMTSSSVVRLRLDLDDDLLFELLALLVQLLLSR